jgi:3-deoxy-manno-octulosonate cytidylyltransferase (CMP-KDO synthetase)
LPRPGIESMIDPENTIVVIPARMASKLLPGKPLADLGGIPLVVRTLRQAASAQLGPVLVAASDHVLAEAVRRHGGDAIATDPRHQTAYARVAEALRMRDRAGAIAHVVILPCDLPFLDHLSLRRCLAGLTNEQVEIATLATALQAPEDTADISIPKVQAPLNADRELAWARGFPFWSDSRDDIFKHINVFALRRATLDRLAAASHGESLTDLAKAQGIRIAAVKVDSKPFRVDTPAQLEVARRMLRD